jgi:hypothetical protein
MHKLVILALMPLALLGACGGGGGGGGTSGGGPPPPTQMIATPGPPNVEPLIMDAGPPANANNPTPAKAVNTAYITVKICIPNGGACQTIDHIEVDTGSSGLRVLASADSPFTLNLPSEMSAGGLPIAECLQFADGSSFGPVALAEITLPTSGKMISNPPLNVQVIGATGWTVPSDCPGTAENTVAHFGANGILGVGPFLQDCGAACAQLPVIPGTYYTCPTPATCAGATATTAEQVANPVSLFASDYNGVIVEMPAIASGGAINPTGGALVFGIGTQSNNALGSATVLPASDVTGYVLATYNGTMNLNAGLDSGSNANFFNDSTIPTCPSNASFYCPASTLNSLSATLQGTNGAMATASFPYFIVVNADNAFNANPNATAMPGLSGPIGALSGSNVTIQFDLGMPFFFGHNVFTAFETKSTPGGTGPYFAF